MILYHGSNMIIDEIDLDKCKPYKDFGQGLYCTEIKEQTELIVPIINFSIKSSVVTSYILH